jgi:hypothetical protein
VIKVDFTFVFIVVAVISFIYLIASSLSKSSKIDELTCGNERLNRNFEQKKMQYDKVIETYNKRRKTLENAINYIADTINKDFYETNIPKRFDNLLYLEDTFLKYYERLKKEYKKKNEELEKSYKKKNQILDMIQTIEKAELEDIIKSTFPFNKVASLCADAETIIFKEEYKNLVSKSHPAYTAAETVKKLRKEAKAHIEAYKIMLYKYDYLLCQFPELEKYVDDYEAIKATCDTTTLKETEYLYDKTKDWISDDEYKLLNEDERNQLALDKYINSNNKSKWKIGRDYELYIGYKFRSEGWKVTQFGIERKLEDLGRDLIVSKVDNNNILQVRVVQCKMWSRDKQIHENAICQLYGTTIQYIMENKNLFDLEEKVLPVFVSTTELSETALRFAKFLNVQVKVVPMEEFPRIKCNISKEGEKIYHLPFDQQYDTAKIDKPGEFYAWTVKEAVDAGFRRAFRYTAYNS